MDRIFVFERIIRNIIYCPYHHISPYDGCSLLRFTLRMPLASPFPAY